MLDEDIHLNSEIAREEYQTEACLDVPETIDGCIEGNESPNSRVLQVVCFVNVAKNGLSKVSAAETNYTCQMEVGNQSSHGAVVDLPEAKGDVTSFGGTTHESAKLRGRILIARPVFSLPL